MTSSVFNNIHTPRQYTAPPVATANSTTMGEAIAASKVGNGADTAQFTNTQAPKRKGIVKTINEGIGNFKKFMASAETYTVAGFKGTFRGAVFGALAFSTGVLINQARKLPHIMAKKAKGATEEVIKSADQQITKLAKNNKYIGIAAAAIGLVTTIGTLWKANLDLNEKKSAIEHRFVGHNQ